MAVSNVPNHLHQSTKPCSVRITTGHARICTAACPSAEQRCRLSPRAPSSNSLHAHLNEMLGPASRHPLEVAAHIQPQMLSCPSWAVQECTAWRVGHMRPLCTHLPTHIHTQARTCSAPHLRAPTLGSRISAAHLPHGRCRTPLYCALLVVTGGAACGCT